MGTGKVSLRLVVGALAWVGSAGAWAQQVLELPPDSISLEECSKHPRQTVRCYTLGVRYATGEGVTQDVDKGLAYLGAACRARFQTACSVQGWTLLKHRESAVDVETGLKLIERACRAGEPSACATLGSVYADGVGVPQDMEKGVGILEKACKANGSLACHALAQLLASGEGIERDAARAQALFLKACQLGSPGACDAACAAGDGEACLAVGRHLSRRKSPDAARVDRAYQMACESGVARGCFLLSGRTADAGQSLALLERACTLGEASGCVRAGRAHYLGLGVAADLPSAVRFYAAACEKGAGCHVLGGIYARGEMGADAVAQGQEFLRQGCREDVACLAILANGRIPANWGGSLAALRPSSAPPPPVEPVRVGDKITEPRKIHHAAPVYPPVARSAHIQGTVEIECVVDETGVVRDMKVIRSVPLLDVAALAAVRQWRYEPTLLNGEPVPVIMTVTVNFRIS